jgi:hypothetical protein
LLNSLGTIWFSIYPTKVKISLASIVDGPVKTRKLDSLEKLPSCGAQISRGEAHAYTPQRLRDAAQRRKWLFTELSKIMVLPPWEHEKISWSMANG